MSEFPYYMEMGQILFFGILSLILCTISGFTALGAIVGLSVSSFTKRIITGCALATPILFILANVWFSFAPNIFSQIFYIITSTVGGMFLYWFFASLIICLLYLFSFAIKIPLRKISTALYMFATVVGVTGFVQAFMTRTVTYTVETPSQYSELKGKRIALISDTHFGPVNQELFARHVVKKILDTHPDAVLLAGDMFDGEDFNMTDTEKELKVLTDQVPVFFTPGNHEEYGPYSKFLASAQKAGMTVLADEKAEIFGVPIFGLNFRSKKDPSEVASLLAAKDISSAHPAIVISHEPSFQKELQNAGVFLNVSGHTHGGQVWPGLYITQKIYGKYWYGLVTEGKYNSITTNGIGTFGPRMRTFNRGEVVVIEFK